MIQRAHSSLDLNFAVEQDGKKPVIVAQYQSRLNPFEAVSYGLSVYLFYGITTATSSYFTMVATLGVIAWGK